MEWLILLVLVGLAIAAWRFWPNADVNKDGKVSVEDVKAAAETINDQITDAVTQTVIKAEEKVADVTKKVAEKATKNVTKKKAQASTTAGKATGAGSRKKT